MSESLSPNERPVAQLPKANRTIPCKYVGPSGTAVLVVHFDVVQL